MSASLLFFLFISLFLFECIFVCFQLLFCVLYYGPRSPTKIADCFVVRTKIAASAPAPLKGQRLLSAGSACFSLCFCFVSGFLRRFGVVLTGSASAFVMVFTTWYCLYTTLLLQFFCAHESLMVRPPAVSNDLNRWTTSMCCSLSFSEAVTTPPENTQPRRGPHSLTRRESHTLTRREPQGSASSIYVSFICTILL